MEQEKAKLFLFVDKLYMKKTAKILKRTSKF